MWGVLLHRQLRTVRAFLRLQQHLNLDRAGITFSQVYDMLLQSRELCISVLNVMVRWKVKMTQNHRQSHCHNPYSTAVLYQSLCE